jgi:hypothetical protein
LARAGDDFGKLCCAVAPFVAGAIAVFLGQDSNWDLRNYHWYNPYAFLTDRFSFDLAPATFYNPLLDMPLFVAAQVLPARLCGFVLGLIQGLNFVLLYLLARRLCPTWAQWRAGAGGALIALVGFFGGGALGLIGTTFYDNVVSLPILGALTLALRALEKPRVPIEWLFVGLLVGAAIGLKLPTAIYGVGVGAACLFASGTLRTRLARPAVFGSGAFIGLLATGGFWMWHLWSTFENPIYPYFNDLFGSAYALPATYRDARFIPTSWLEALFFPIVFTRDPLETGEVLFRDLRIVALFLTAIATSLFTFARRRDTAATPTIVGSGFALTTWFAAFVVWEAVFAIYRYVISLEMLAPVLGAALIARWPLRERARLSIALASAALLLVTTQAANWGRTVWSERFVDVQPPRVAAPADTMALMVGFTPASWVIPAFPPEIPFVRLQGYSHSPDDGDVGLAAVARRRIATHRGSFYLLCARGERKLAREVLAKYGLEPDLARCEAIAGNLDDDLRWCPVHRTLRAP